MALPSPGELGGSGITTAQFQARIEALRDAVATLQSELDAAEIAIQGNDTDIDNINTSLSNKLESSDLADYQQKILTANATSIWTGSSTDIAAGSITGGITTGTYIFEVGGSHLVHMTLINVTWATEVVYGIFNTGSGIGIQTIEHTLVNGSRFRIYQKTIGGTTPTYTTTSPANITEIWRL